MIATPPAASRPRRKRGTVAEPHCLQLARGIAGTAAGGKSAGGDGLRENGAICARRVVDPRLARCIRLCTTAFIAARRSAGKQGEQEHRPRRVLCGLAVLSLTVAMPVNWVDRHRLHCRTNPPFTPTHVHATGARAELPTTATSPQRFYPQPLTAAIMEDGTRLAPAAFMSHSVSQWTNITEILGKMRCHLRKCLEHSGVPGESISFPELSSIGPVDSGRGQGVNVASRSRCFLLQFKCPNQQMDNSGERPAFRIDASHLRALKRYPPGSAFYVLPLTADRKRFASSCILDKTCIIDVHDIMPECGTPAETDRITIHISADKRAHVWAGSQCRDLNARPLRCLCDPVESLPKIPVLGFPAAGGGRSDPRELETHHQHLHDEWKRKNPDETIDKLRLEHTRKMLCDWIARNPAGTPCFDMDSFGDGKDPDRLLVMCVDYGSAGADKGSP